MAAPTAGLHFTPEMLDDLAARGVERTAVTLHVGYGTFKPVRAERVVEVVHVLGDGDNILVGTRLPGGDEITAVIYIDHNAGRSDCRSSGIVIAARAARTVEMVEDHGSVVSTATTTTPRLVQVSGAVPRRSRWRRSRSTVSTVPRRSPCRRSHITRTPLFAADSNSVFRVS